jgi:hypothetical protein
LTCGRAGAWLTGEPDPGECLLQVLQQRFYRVSVLDAGCRDQDGQQQADGVDGDVPLAAVDLLPGNSRKLISGDGRRWKT